MSYQVIARRWRSQSFKDLIGQEHITQTLMNALKADRFPHALLFCGTRGVGKTSSARILAKTLICPNAVDFVPCNECSACLDITNGSHMDVVEIDGASNNGVDAIRELRETVGYIPSNGKYKIYIIDEVHMLSTSAFNALLKTLEEPPAHVIFIMATTEPQKIPVTILSRCQRFDFRRISTKLIQDHIKNICETEKVTFEKEAIWTLARLADGSMRDGLSLLDQAINFTNSQLTQKNVAAVLGTTDRSLLNQTLSALISRNLAGALAVVENLFHKGIDPTVFCENLLEEIRNLTIVKISQNPQTILDFSETEINNLKGLCQDISAEDLHLLFDMCLKGTQDVLKSQSPQIVLEMLLMRMAQAPKISDISSFIQNSTPTSSGDRSKPTPQHVHASLPVRNSLAGPPPPTSTDRSATTPVAPEAVKFEEKKSLAENWTIFIGQVRMFGPILGAQLEHSALVDKTAEKIVLSIADKDKFFFEQLKENKQILKIKEALKRVWNEDLQVEVQIHKEDTHQSPKDIEKIEIKKKDDEIQRKVEEHPVIKNVQSVFNGKISDIKEL